MLAMTPCLPQPSLLAHAAGAEGEPAGRRPHALCLCPPPRGEDSTAPPGQGSRRRRGRMCDSKGAESIYFI